MAGVEQKAVTEDEADMRVDRWIRKHFPAVSNGMIQKLLRKGEIRVDGKRARANHNLDVGSLVRLPPQVTATRGEKITDKPKKPIRDEDIAWLKSLVIYQDADVVAINKPHGVAVQGGTGIKNSIDDMLDVFKAKTKGGGKDAPRPKLVHRLDKDTSGVMLIARNDRAARALTKSFRSRDARKYYWALTIGVPDIAEGRIDAPIGPSGQKGREMVVDDPKAGKPASTDYAVVDRVGNKAAWVAFWPRTGRTHQIRVHAHYIGTPLYGDNRYFDEEKVLDSEGELPERTLHLHARRIILPHPHENRTLDITAPLSKEMEKSWSYFGFSKNDDGDPFAELDCDTGICRI